MIAVPLSRALRAFDADSFVARHGGRKESRYAGSREYLLNCPKCGSSRLRWNVTKGGWICWSCKEVGDTIGLIAMFEQCDYEKAIAIIEDGYVGGDAPTALAPAIAEAAAARQQRRTKPYRLPARTLPPCVPVWEHAQVWAYVQARGIDTEKAYRYGLLAGVSGPTAGYVIFPCRMEGATVYWQGRASWDPPFTGEAAKLWIKQTGYRKTLNPLSHEGRASGSEVLFGFDFARTHPHVVVVEGPVDAIKVGSNATALLGQGTEAKLMRLRSMMASRYTIYLDRGEQERKRAEWLARELAAFGDTYIAVPPEGFDAGKLTPEQNAEVIARAERYTAGLESRLA